MTLRKLILSLVLCLVPEKSCSSLLVIMSKCILTTRRLGKQNIHIQKENNFNNGITLKSGKESQPEVGSSPAVPINQVTGNDCSAETWRRSNSKRSLKKRLMVRITLAQLGQGQLHFISTSTC